MTAKPLLLAEVEADEAGRPSTLEVKSGLDLPHLDADHRLRKVLSGALARANIGRPELGQRSDEPYWDAAHFGLDRVGAFRALSDEKQRDVLLRAARDTLTEAYFIEKLGLGFGAKMVLLAETTEERMLYALFSADEGRHLQAVATHLEDAERIVPTSPFHLLLAELIEDGDKPTLTFSIQVVLEGWGLTHYRDLADDCRSEALKGVLRGVLEDEARHHGSGKVLVEERGLPARSRAYVTEVLARFLGMVQVGPQAVLSALDEAHGGLTLAQQRQAFTDIDGAAHAGERLQLLERLMDVPAAASVLDTLRERGAFSPRPLP